MLQRSIRLRLSSRIIRQYSTETPPPPPSDPPTENGKTENNDLEKQLAEMKDKYLRQVAEYRNLQSRTEREVSNAKDYAIQKFAKDLLDSVDNLDRALSNVPSTAEGELKTLAGGLDMTRGILLKTMERHGLKRITSVGEKYNPNLHEVLYEAPKEGSEAGVIFDEQVVGYTLNNRTIRAAKVGVVKEVVSGS